jgi:hypothetical protein
VPVQSESEPRWLPSAPPCLNRGTSGRSCFPEHLSGPIAVADVGAVTWTSRDQAEGSNQQVALAAVDVLCVRRGLPTRPLRLPNAGGYAAVAEAPPSTR